MREGLRNVLWLIGVLPLIAFVFQKLYWDRVETDEVLPGLRLPAYTSRASHVPGQATAEEITRIARRIVVFRLAGLSAGAVAFAMILTAFGTDGGARWSPMWLVLGMLAATGAMALFGSSIWLSVRNVSAALGVPGASLGTLAIACAHAHPWLSCSLLAPIRASITSPGASLQCITPAIRRAFYRNLAATARDGWDDLWIALFGAAGRDRDHELAPVARRLIQRGVFRPGSPVEAAARDYLSRIKGGLP